MEKNIWRGVVLCVGIPLLYVGYTSHSRASFILGWLILFLCAPYYFMICGLIVYCLIGILPDHLSTEVGAYVIVGYLWIGAKLFWSMNYSMEKRGRQNGRRTKVEEQQLQTAKEEFERVWRQHPGPSESLLVRLADCNDSPLTVNYFYIDDVCNYTYASAVRSLQNRQRKRQKLEEEQSEVSNTFEAFITTCADPWSELMRTAAAFGSSNLDFIKTVKYDVLQILHTMLVASGIPIPDTMGRICQAVCAKLEPEEFPSLIDCTSSIVAIESQGVSLPIAVRLLSFYGKLMKQHGSFDAIAACSYHSLVIAASGCFPFSRPIEIAKDSYLQLLRPYISGVRKDGYNERSASSASGQTNRRSVCQTCATSYLLLDLPLGATRSEVEQKRRDFAQVFHSDHLSSKSERVRGAADEHLSRINAACDQILRCPSCALSTS